MRPEAAYVPFSAVVEELGGVGKPSGLDLGPTLKWMERNRNILDHKLNGGHKASLLPPIRDHEKTQLHLPDIQNLIGLFPPQSRSRSIATRIQGNGPLWFHKDSLTGQPRHTPDPGERLTPTAIIPGYTEYLRGSRKQLEATIHLCHIPEEGGTNFPTARVMLAEAFCHEYVHTLATPLLYSDDVFEMPDGTLVDGLEFVMLTFGNLVEVQGPISHYAAFYRDGNNKFVKDKNGNPQVAVGEEFAETVTAYVLGYASGLLTDIADPLGDRPELKPLVGDFLRARVIKRAKIETSDLVDPMELADRYIA